MNNVILKTFLVATLFAGAGINTPVIAQVQPTLSDVSIIPEGLITLPDVTTDVMIVLDNSGSMRRDSVNGTELIGPGHGNSRSFQAREAIRNVLAGLEGNINVGLMEFDTAWRLGTVDGDRYAVNTCGDQTPPIVAFDPTHLPTPTVENCATPIGTAVNADGDTVNTYNLDQFNRIISDENDRTYFNVFNGGSPDNRLDRARLRVGVQELSPAHLERLNNVLAPEFIMPELRCDRRFRGDQSNNNGGFRNCDDNDANPRSDYNASDFLPGVTPSLANEGSRINTASFARPGNPDYGTGESFLIDANNDGQPDAYLDPEAPSLSVGGTPSYPALLATHNYLRGESTQFTNLLQTGDSLNSPASSSTESAFTSSISACTVSTFIIFITDGLPTVTFGSNSALTSLNEETCSNGILPSIANDYQCQAVTGANSVAVGNVQRRTAAHVRNSIAPLLTSLRVGQKVDVNANNGNLTLDSENFNSVETFVFGFGDLNSTFDQEILNTMANAGSLVEETDANGNPVLDANGDPQMVGRDAFLASNGAQLEADLLALFGELTPNISTNSGFSISTSPVSGGGAIVSPGYVPSITLDDGNGIFETVYWTGEVSSFFQDEFGFFREDTNGDGILGDYNVDFAFTLSFDEDTEASTAQRLTITNSGALGSAAFDPENDIVEGASFSPSDLNPIWSASEQLNQFPQTVNGSNVNLYGEVQRPYDDPAQANVQTGYRTIYTAQPGQNGDLVQTDFLEGIVNNANFGLFAVDSVQDAQDVVRYTRGEEGIPALDQNGNTTLVEVAGQTGVFETVDKFRSRTIGDQQFLLGDIVHSSPVVVGAPEEDFGIADQTYADFQEQYLFRRRMVYVGGNDGLLHAFNGGFFQAANGTTNTAFRTQATLAGCTGGDCDQVAHELGAEVWAYAPYNLLPHLQFLTGTDYRSNVHVAFVDGRVQSFDVQSFAADATHPDGWGTIIVANMRLGGSPFEVDPDGNGNGPTVTTRSAYVVFDVTDPSQEPVLLAEITDEDIGFTTSLPTIQRSDSTDDWFLVFGSGPNNPTDFISEPELATPNAPRTPKFYRYNLNSEQLETPIVVNNDNGFIGDLVSQDWDSDLDDDAVYFGVVGGDIDNPSGGVYRYVSDPNATGGNRNDVAPLFIANEPVSSVPATASNNGANWVLFGTGRILADGDFDSTTGPNAFYGIIEPRGNYGQATGEIVNVTDVTSSENGNLVDADGSGQAASVNVDGVAINTELALGTAIVSNDDVDGWQIDLELSDPSERVTANPIVVGDQVVFASFVPGEPNEDICVPVTGESFLNVAGISTGIPDSDAASFGLLEDGNGAINRRTAAIGGTPILQLAAVVSRSLDGPGTKTDVVTKGGNGELDATLIEVSARSFGRTSWTELEVQ